ncbi:GDSL-type esterase/lipase family protein [Neolewinella litorea]|uniref:SGNH/GDSL hydrolase family protein n=1 Tax=Neolewinella litorea TaxID=2562452 RepID=A0A4S4NRY2_9BACT|nr:GDSL-type esterase/lipase family protein [Neolewinella litorea]THH41171.1 SGNH/GDSL hydrolase family protein [Neolewinella litorea]
MSPTPTPLVTLYLLLLGTLLPQQGFTQARDSLLIDFGTVPSALPWNNLPDFAGGSIASLTNSRSLPTSYSISVTDAFTGVNTAGTQDADPELGLPASATGDSFFGNTGEFGGSTEPTGAVTLSGLRTDKEYTLTIFASRNGANDNREAAYVLEGESTETVYLDAANNESGVVRITQVPAADGTIRLQAGPGPNNDNPTGFYYLGAVIVSYDQEDTPPPPPPPPTGPDELDTVLVDFGGSSTSPAPWNNITDPDAGSIADLQNSSGFQTGYGLNIYDRFNNINTNGTLNPNSDLDLVASATGDSFFGNVSEFGGRTEPTAGLELTGLNPEKTYSVELFASRSASDNRETQYIVTGATRDSVYLDVASNADSIAVATLQPSAEGTLRIDVGPGPNNTNGSKFYYLGVLRLTYANEDAAGETTLKLTAPNGGEFWQAGKTPSITWESQNLTDVVLEYSINNGQDWTTIDTVPAFDRSYSWTVPATPTDSALVRILADSLFDVSDSVFEISSDTTSCTIVVLGSSTAEGTGASNPDSAWVNRYADYLSDDTRYEVVNLARGGYTTYHILPTGADVPAGVNITPDPTRNITRALEYDPFAVIINMPSNDAANNFPVEDQLENFAAVITMAREAGVEVWVATTQPRNFTNTSQVELQREVRDSLFAIYGDRAIDFWTGVADGNGFILDSLDSGDGIHLNDAGHRLLFDRVVDLRLDTFDCSGMTDPVRSIITSLSGVSVFPNPNSTGVLNITLPAEVSGLVEVRIIDLLGRERFRQEGRIASGGQQRLQIPTGDFAGRTGAGEYFICLVTVKDGNHWRRQAVGVMIR